MIWRGLPPRQISFPTPAPKVMKTYKIELRHAPSKNKLNALRNNRLPPLTARLSADEEAIGWARLELIRIFERKRSPEYQYLEAGVWELLPLGPNTRDDDSRRLGRWVCNGEGMVWRPRQDQDQDQDQQ
jgi:hypothetical protein